MEEIYCPYCEKGFDLNHDDGAYYSEDYREEATCPWCDKKFMITASMSWSYDGEKADCLNGSEHIWEKKYNVDHYPNLVNKEICHQCDEERTI